MDTEHILVVSSKPLFCEGLKLLIEEAGLGTVITASSDNSAARLAQELAPSVTVLDRPDTRPTNLKQFFRRQNHSEKVVVVGWNDDKIAVYSRCMVEAATLKNLIKVIKEIKGG